MSRELDAEVAEKVMGWSQLSDGEAYPNTFDEIYPLAQQAGFNKSRVTGWWFDPSSRNDRGEAQGMRSSEDYDDCGKGFAPSTDISDAMEVVEKMQEAGYDVEMLAHSQWWWVVFKKTHEPTERHSGAALPEVICLAALATLTKEQK